MSFSVAANAEASAGSPCEVRAVETETEAAAQFSAEEPADRKQGTSTDENLSLLSPSTALQRLLTTILFRVFKGIFSECYFFFFLKGGN